MKIRVIIFMLAVVVSGLCQDSLHFKSDRQKAFYQILDLKDSSALVFRVILKKKNAELYRAAGKYEIADRIEKKSNRRNRLLAKAFLDESFNFCPVYIIESKDYGRVLNGDSSGYFLDNNLKVDEDITLKEKNVYFVDIGDVYEAVKRDDSYRLSELTGTPVVHTALVIKDKSFNQLVKPFPFYVPLERVQFDLMNYAYFKMGKDYSTEEVMDINDYEKYMMNKYNLKKGDLFLITKVFYLNYKLHGYYSRAKAYKVNGGFER